MGRKGGVMGNNLQIIRVLSPAYAGREGELTAILQYVYQSILLDGCHKTKEAKKLMSIAVQEMHHLEEIGALLVKLGVPPVFTSCPPYPVGFYSASNVDYVKSYPQMLAADIRAEQDAIAYYTHVLDCVQDEHVREVITAIRSDEEQHLCILKELCSEIS